MKISIYLTKGEILFCSRCKKPIIESDAHIEHYPGIETTILCNDCLGKE